MQISMGELSPESIGNRKQSLATAGKPEGCTQRELALIGVLPPFHRLGEATVARLDFSGCLVHAALHMGLTDAQIAEQIHVCAGYMSRFMRGVAQAWAKRLLAFMRTTQSLAPLEWMAHEMGCELVQRNGHTAQVRALQAELARLTGQAA